MSEADKTVYRVQGFSCANCAGKFENNVQKLPAVHGAKVNFGASKISVYGTATIDELEQAGAFENLKVTPETKIGVTNQKTDDKKEEDPFLKKHSTLLYSILLIAFGFISMAVNGNDNILTPLLFIASMLIGGSNMLKTGLINLTKLEFDMRTLMTVAVIGGVLIGEWAEVAIVVVLFAISEALERFSTERARKSISSLMDIVPKEALIRRNGHAQLIHVDDIQVNDLMIVKPGQKIAMDGIITSGHSSVNQAAITGESLPVEKSNNDEVFAGTLNEEGFLKLKLQN